MTTTESTIPDIDQVAAIELCQRVEDQFYDCKANALSGAGAEKIGVAFANADGGTFIMGIHDADGRPVPKDRWDGAPNPEHFNGVLQALHSLDPPLPFRYDFLQCSVLGGYILRVYVDKSRAVCQTSDRKVYQRVGAQCLQLRSVEKITQLSFAKGYVTFENQKLVGVRPEYVVDSNTLASFVEDVKPRPDGLSYCLNEGLLDYNDWTPLACGVLLFGDQPQGVFPTRCECRVVFYDTRLEVPEREHLKINETIGGPLYQQIHSVVDRVSEIMSGIQILTSDGMKQVKYPPEAI
ncbi:helix-turn-helix domain-containing protein [Devosia sp.]|uniref:AlbA family DNA-binding domain-containing protein n=1 Tax=Devosia sp. TaxID=1871048 RepID=UPI0025BD503B|nr:ATP-binding protein [Devosia sp.]